MRPILENDPRDPSMALRGRYPSQGSSLLSPNHFTQTMPLTRPQALSKQSSSSSTHSSMSVYSKSSKASLKGVAGHLLPIDMMTNQSQKQENAEKGNKMGKNPKHSDISSKLLQSMMEEDSLIEQGINFRQRLERCAAVEALLSSLSKV